MLEQRYAKGDPVFLFRLIDRLARFVHRTVDEDI